MAVPFWPPAMIGAKPAPSRVAVPVSDNRQGSGTMWPTCVFVSGLIFFLKKQPSSKDDEKTKGSKLLLSEPVELRLVSSCCFNQSVVEIDEV